MSRIRRWWSTNGNKKDIFWVVAWLTAIGVFMPKILSIHAMCIKVEKHEIWIQQHDVTQQKKEEESKTLMDRVDRRLQAVERMMAGVCSKVGSRVYTSEEMK